MNSINEILVKLYGNDLELYVPDDVDLVFLSESEVLAKKYIKEHDLSSEDVDLIIKYNLEKNDIISLQNFGYDFHSLKPKTELPNRLKKHSYLLNTKYYGKYRIEASSKLYLSLDNLANNENGADENDV